MRKGSRTEEIFGRRIARRKRSAFDAVLGVLLFLIAAITLYPFLHVIALAFSEPARLLRETPTFYPLGFDAHAFIGLLTRPVIRQAMWLTAGVTLFGTAFSLTLTTVAAFVVSRRTLPGRRFFSYFVLVPMYFTGGMIPTFMIVKALGLYNHLAALVLPIAINEFNFIVMRTFFRDFPEELEDAARIDGANILQILVRVVLPLSLPILATIGLFYAVEYWNDYMQALLYMGDPEKFTLQLRLRSLMGSRRGTSLCVLVGSLPILTVYPFLQRYFVKGVMLGSVKG